VLRSSVLGTAIQRVEKASALSNCHGTAGDRTVTSQCPIKQHCPRPRGQSVGGVSERVGAEAGGSNLSARHSFACRGGRRHPGFLEGGSLRGASSERRPRSVRSGVAVPPPQTRAPMTADVRRSPRRGTPSACATKCMHPSRAREIVARGQGTRPSLGPSTRARQSSLCFQGQLSEVGRQRRHHGWANSRE
jgi:hypothetical protein